MKDSCLIIGKGYIGQRLQEEFGWEISGRKFYTFKDAEEEIKRHNPKTIINCIGYIGRNVDDCELDKDRALMANTFVPIILAEVALRHGIKLIHVSSGCIYHYDYAKDTPITEEKLPDFLDLFYSRTKIYADMVIEALNKKYPFLTLRIRVPLDGQPNPKNLLTKLVAYKKVIDLPNSVTYIPDFIKALKHLITIEASGIYNVVNTGGLSYPRLMEVYKKHVPSFSYEVLDFDKLNLVRTNLVLSTEKLKKSGFKIRPVEEVLEECVQNYIKY